MRKQIKALKHHSDILANGIYIRFFVGDAEAVNNNFALCRRFKPVQAAQKG